ncbi:MAG: RNA chaperone Hfq [Gammaproteobacteria bacterium]|nr:RNA chaperone Hfq [Gammaproteobacteria bacterium]
MPKNQQLEDAFLAQLKNDAETVSVFLVNGIKLHGVIDDYDDHIIMLKSTGTQMIFKHAVSTVVPSARPA